MTKTATTENLKNKLATQGQAAPAAQNNAISPYRKLEAYLVKLKPQITQSLPKTGVTAERLSRLALTTIKQNPKLLEADYGSLLGAIMQAAQAGLEPNYMGSCYLIPHWDRNAGCHLVRFELGYRGMIEIMTRSGRVLKIVSNVVYEKDYFQHSYGLKETLEHIPSDEADRGAITHFYAYAPLDNGQVAFKVLSKEQVDHIRNNYSKAYGGAKNKNETPWVKEYEAMGKKTAIKQLFKDMPIGDREAADLLNNDETVRRDITDDPEKIITVEAYEAEQPEQLQETEQQAPEEPTE
jgi:recombination protein RecT